MTLDGAGRRLDADVAVLLATFNGQRFLPEMLTSLAGQSRPPAELIVGDDGSTDQTLAILEDFAARAPFPVRIIRQPRRRGASDNFLSLIAAAGTTLVAFADQDDVWLPTKLERIGKALRHPGVTLVMHQASLIDESGRPLDGLFPEIPRSVIRRPMDIDPWFPAYGMAMAVDRSALDAAAALGMPPSRDLDGHPLDHDEWAFFVGSTVGSIAMLAEPLTRYRQHPGNYVGAPRLGLSDRITRGLLHDEESYRARQRLVEAYAEFWERAASDDVALPVDLCDAAARRYHHLAARLGRRATALDRSKTFRHRARSFLRLALEGGYSSRRRGGLGSHALIGDFVRLTLPSVRVTRRPVSDATVRRITAERRSGRTLEQIADGLAADRVDPPYGRSWRPAMVRDVLLDASIATERAGIVGSDPAQRTADEN